MASIKRFLKIQTVVSLIIFSLVAVIWVSYYSDGFSNFNKENSVSIYGSVIQGMSALLSIAIAVIIFRIQSLENRNLSLEQSTLNYIYNITHWTYPQWGSSVEDDIRSGKITTRYSILLSTSEEEKKLQQTRLIETLDSIHSTELKIKRTRRNIYSNVILLMLPILSSFLLLMVSDDLNVELSFLFVSTVVLMSAYSIALLISIVFESIS